MYVQHTHNPLGYFFYFFMIHNKIIFFDKDAKFSSQIFFKLIMFHMMWFTKKTDKIYFHNKREKKLNCQHQIHATTSIV